MKYKIGFICVHNSCRSQMAEAFAKSLGSDLIESYSAGSEYYPEVKPLAIKVMEEKGISMDSHFPKLLDALPQDLDFIITMGCGVACPATKAKYIEDWGLDDPSGGPIEDYRKTRDLIEIKVRNLIEKLKNND